MAHSISPFFENLDDPRREQGRRHLLIDLILLTVCAVICGADDWVEVEDFGKAKQAWLKTFLKLPHGIASHDTLGRVFARLDPQATERCFMQWFEHLAQIHKGQLIAIDGKTLRHSYDTASNQAAIHMVSAWCNTNHLVLGQLATEAKSNEISAIPMLLELLDIKNAIVTIDAMGCQKTIAQKIIKQEGDYVLQVKDNHKTLHEDLKLLFDEANSHGFEAMAYAYHETIEKGHGRIETRRLWSTWDIDWLKRYHDWTGLQSVACVESVRELIDPAGGPLKRSVERRYYISSLNGRDAQAILHAVRSHWGIENSLHWSLDMTFGEDTCRVRTGHGPEHLSRVRRAAISLLKREKTFIAGLKRKRLRCALDHGYLLKVLTM